MLILPPSNRYLKFEYNGLPRLALDIEDDQRNPNNRYMMTTEGRRTFNKQKMENVEDVTSVLV